MSYFLQDIQLTHLLLAPHICVWESGQHWFRQWLVTYSTPNHYLYQCWVILNWTLRNKFQRHFSETIELFHSRKRVWKCRAKWWPFYMGRRVEYRSIYWGSQNMFLQQKVIVWQRSWQTHGSQCDEGGKEVSLSRKYIYTRFRDISQFPLHIVNSSSNLIYCGGAVKTPLVMPNLSEKYTLRNTQI